jgi:hypothetical protein
MFMLPRFLSFAQVVELNVHTADSVPVVFRSGNAEAAARGPQKLTPLLAYFNLNNRVVSVKERELLNTLTFKQIPEYYVIDKDTREWRRRVHCNKPTIGCLYAVAPKDRERYFLRALLLKRTCPLSYEDLRTVDTVPYDSFREAAVALGLVRGDEEYRRYVFLINFWVLPLFFSNSTLQESVLGGSPFSVRMLFVTLVLHCCPADPRALFEEFWEHMRNAHWNKERLLRYLARKMLLNNAELDKQMFAEVNVEELGNEDDELEQDEGQQVYVPLSQAELDGKCFF